MRNNLAMLWRSQWRETILTVQCCHRGLREDRYSCVRGERTDFVCSEARQVSLNRHDETVSQTKPSDRAQTHESDCRGGSLRVITAAVHSGGFAKNTGKRGFSAISLSESAVRMSLGRTVLEEMLLLQQLPENCVGKST